MNAESTTVAYWENEAKLKAIECVYGCDIDTLIEDLTKIPDETISRIECLLIKKKELLGAMRVSQKKALATSPVVDLSKYRQLSKIVVS